MTAQRHCWTIRGMSTTGSRRQRYKLAVKKIRWSVLNAIMDAIRTKVSIGMSMLHIWDLKPKNRKKYDKFMCSECNLVFSGTRVLSRHALDAHRKVLKIKKNPRISQQQRKTKLAKDKLCYFCPYSTAYEFNLRNHMNAMHLKERNYKCPLRILHSVFQFIKETQGRGTLSWQSENH